MPYWVPVILAIAALLTSILSAIIGMGGGMLLLATMLCFMSHGEAIPTHAAVQIVSNGTRTLAFLKSVDRMAYLRFVVGVVPGAAVGMLLLWTIGEPEQSEPYLKTLIGVFILTTTLLPRAVSTAHVAGREWEFSLIGLVAGTAALTVGAIGPLIAPIFARHDFIKERLIATKAACQVTTHALKIPAFLLLRELDLAKLGLVTGVMIVMVIPGTLVGRRLLRGVADHHFRIAFRVALTAAGLKVLLYDGLRPLLFSS